MKTILVVDDEFDIADSLKLILEDEGYDVITRPNGREALETIEKSPPSLVLLDVMMPGLSGLDVLSRVRGNGSTRALPIILMSAVNPRVKQADYGWDAFVQKPFTLDGLLEHIQRLIGPGAMQAR